MLSTVFLSLSLQAISFRLATENVGMEFDPDAEIAETPTCECSESGVVDGVSTGKGGCAQHFGQRFGYICYVNNGADCPGARLSRRTGVYWRTCREEHLTDEAVGHLMEAMEEIDLDELRTVIGIAQERGVDPELIAAAEARVEVVIRMIAARDELTEALRGFSVERLQAALETAEELELDEFLSEDTLENAVERFRFLEQRTAAAETLRTAIEGHLLTVLQEALHDAKVKHCDDDIIQDGEARVVVLQGLIAAADEELAAAVLTRDSVRLQAAKHDAQRLMAVDATRIQAAEDRLAHLSRMDAAVTELDLAIAAFDLSDLQTKLQIARDLDAYPADLAQGDARVAQLTQRNLDAEAVLVAATADYHISALEEAIAAAEKLHGGTISAANIEAGRTRLADLNRRGEAQNELEVSIEDVDLVDLRAKLARALDLGLQESAPEVVARAEERIVDIQEMQAEAAEVLAAAVAAEHDGTDKATVVLVAAMAEIERLHCVRDFEAVTQETVDAAQARLERFQELDAASQRLVAVYESEDMHEIITALANARTVGVVQDAIDKAEEQAARVRILMRDARQLMIDLTEGTDADALQAALDEVNRLRAASPRRIQAAEDRVAALRR